MYITFLWLIYFVTESLYILIPFTDFTHYSTSFTLATIHLFSVSISLFTFFFACFFFFLGSTYKCNHMVYIHLSLSDLFHLT